MWHKSFAPLTALVWLASATPQITSFQSFANSTRAPATTSSTYVTFDPNVGFVDMCPGATVNFTCSQDRAHLGVTMLYWLSSTTLYLPPQTIQYDVVQDGSTTITVATHTKQSNVSTLDMRSYTDLVPKAQRGGCGGAKYCISTVEPVYGSTDILTSTHDGTTWSDTITYPTPYGLVGNIRIWQTAVCADGQTVMSAGDVYGLGPIPGPQTLDYTDWNVEIFSSIPGFTDAISSRFPKIAHCTWGGFNGQPLPKVVVSALTVETTNVVTTTRGSSASSKAPSAEPTTREAATTATPTQTAPATTALLPTTSPSAPPPAEPSQTQPPAGTDQDASSSSSHGAGSLILCGLGGPCATASIPPTADDPPADGPPDDSRPAPPTAPETVFYTASAATFYLGPSPSPSDSSDPSDPSDSSDSSNPDDSNSPPANAPTPAAIPLHTASNGAVVVGGGGGGTQQTTLSAGGPAATISDVVVSAGTDGVHLDGSVLSHAPATADAPAEATFAIGGETYTYTSGASELALGGTTTVRLGGGGVATVAGAAVGVGSGGGVVVGGSAVPFVAQTAAAGAVAKFTVGGEGYGYAAGAGTVVVGSVTLTVGGDAATVGGQVVSVGTAGVVVDGSTVVPMATAAPEAVFTVGGVAYTATDGASTVVVGGQTLTAGGSAVTVAGQTLSFGPNGVVVGGSTVAFENGAATAADVAVVTVGGSAYTFKEGETTLVVGSKTLTVGGSAITVSGEVVSLGPSGVVVDGSSTVPFSNTAAPTVSSIGSGSGTPAQYTGSAEKERPYSHLILWAMLLGVTLALALPWE